MSELFNLERSIPISIHNRKRTPLLSFHQDLAKVLDEWVGGYLPSTGYFENQNLVPAIDIINNPTEFKIEIEMPGMGEDDVKVSISDRILTIKGEKTTSKQDKDKNYLMREINYGKYERSLTLPDSVDITQAKASFKKSMLWIHIPKKTELTSKSREITVEKAE